MILPKALADAASGAAAFNFVHENFDKTHLGRCQEWVSEWLRLRHLGDARKISGIHLTKGFQELLDTPMWPGGPTFFDFNGNSACELPDASPNAFAHTDLYLLDYDPDMWFVFKSVEDKTKCWMQWHGTNFYSLSTILALNYLSVSKNEKGP